MQKTDSAHQGNLDVNDIVARQGHLTSTRPKRASAKILAIQNNTVRTDTFGDLGSVDMESKLVMQCTYERVHDIIVQYSYTVKKSTPVGVRIQVQLPLVDTIDH